MILLSSVCCIYPSLSISLFKYFSVFLFTCERGEHASSCLFICSLLMTRHDTVIIDILIRLSSASIPLISFVSFPFLPCSSCVLHLYFFLLSICHPFFLTSQSLLCPPLPLVDRTCSFIYRLTLTSFIVIRYLPFLFSSCLPCLPRHHFFFSHNLLLPICSSLAQFSLLSTSSRISLGSLFFFSMLPPFCSIFDFYLP